MIRDKRKSAEYFDKYIEYQKTRISTKEEKLASAGSDDAKKTRINLSQLSYKLNLIFAEYSAGYSTKDIIKSVESAIDTAIEMQKVGFEPMLNILALQVVLGDSYKIAELAEKHKSMIEKDKLLNCFAKYIQTKKFIWEGDFSVAKVFDGLDKLVTSNDKEAELCKYLETWYANRKAASWYGTDKNDNDVYVGYWSFESAAVVKIFGVSPSSFYYNDYFPKDFFNCIEK